MFGQTQSFARPLSEDHGHKQPEMWQMWQWMPGAERDRVRHEITLDFTQVSLLQLGAGVGRQRCPRGQMHPGRGRIAETDLGTAGLRLEQLPNGVLNGRQSVHGRRRVRLDDPIPLRGAFVDRRLAEFGHPDHVQLVEIARDDAQESHPFQQRHAGVFGQRQHTPLKRHQTQFGVQQFDGISKRRHCMRKGWAGSGADRPQHTRVRHTPLASIAASTACFRRVLRPRVGTCGARAAVGRSRGWRCD
jgi:hypothetical protein